MDRCIQYVNQADLNERQAQPEARRVKPGERDLGNPPTYLWLGLRQLVKNAIHLKKHYHSPNPALNVRCHQEPIATDYVYSDVPAVDDGSMGAQIFIGMESEVCDAQGLKSPKLFVNSLEDNIQKCGAMDKLLNDRAQTKIGTWAQDILRALFISSWQSKPHQQQQNPAERKYQMLKWYTNTILSHTSAPANTWLLCLLYVCFLLNCPTCQSLNW